MLISNHSKVADIVQSIGNTDYVKDGIIVSNEPVKLVLVSAIEELEGIDNYNPGTIAYTAAFAQMWQKSPSGQWVTFV